MHYDGLTCIEKLEPALHGTHGRRDMLDPRTAAYFNKYTPHFNHFWGDDFVTEFIQTHSNAQTSLIEIGSGDGSVLLRIRETTPVRDLTGLDSSHGFLACVRERVGCETILGSILDPEVSADRIGQYDFCIMVAMLHNLVCRNRRESRQAARQGIANAYSLLKPGGHLIIFEPAYYSRFAMDLVFHVKKFVSLFTDNPVRIPGLKFSFGLPLLSWYTPGELNQMVASLEGAEIVKRAEHPAKRLHLVLSHVGIGLIVKNFSRS